MCGIFGLINSSEPVKREHLDALAKHSLQRGADSSGLFFHDGDRYRTMRANYKLTKLVKQLPDVTSGLVMGHSRLVTNGLDDNQPVLRDGVCVLHNGIVVNHESLWDKIGGAPRLQIDTEVIAAITARHLERGESLESLAMEVLGLCHGVVACAIAVPRIGKVFLFSNNGSLYLGRTGDTQVFASEAHPLREIGCTDVRQIREPVILDIPAEEKPVLVLEKGTRKTNLIPTLPTTSHEEHLLQYPQRDLRRCSRCILPETMPFISFDDAGVCNYCHNYTTRNHPRPVEELFDIVEPYRRAQTNDCIVPFSGGRDSCYGLHLIVNELKMRPVTYTYDWGMVTDLGRRNISRMCAELGVENIIVADDIAKKRSNIAKNLTAWLRSPHLGMISILTAGDKHFFRHIETVKEQTGISLNLWGVNPLEVTHFKAGFLGVPPDFAEERVYSHGAMKQLRYQKLRFRAMLDSPRYFNTSLWDTLSGEYWRSFANKSDYFHIFDYWRWDEGVIDKTLDGYGWERAPDTNTTWRIGDGTAAFYNYIYYLVAGFTEHDTFRSNQIREGELSREAALTLVADENRPRYPNIKWYLDAIGLDFTEVIESVNRIPRLVP